MSKASEVITCKAVVSWGASEPLVIEEIEVEPPKSGEVRIKMLCASLCHSDILYSKGFPVPLFPKVMGHEGVGVVESIGEGVTEFEVGDTVIPIYLGECKECENCKSGESNLCEKYPVQMNGLMLDGTSRMSCRGQRLYHMVSYSTWSQYMVVNGNYLVKADPSVVHSHASLVSCGYTTGFGAAWRVAGMKKGSTVAVFGLGGVGLGAAEGARLMGASKIIGVDLNDRKKEMGKVYGVTDFINPGESKKSVPEMIKDVNGGKGVDYSFECTGVASVLNDALGSTRQGTGMTILLGAGGEMYGSINLFDLVFGKTVKGCAFGGIRPRSDLPAILSKSANKEINLDSLVTHEVELHDINRAFELLKQPDCVKVIIRI